MSKVPTLTLARLYEAQNLLLDAYVVYRSVQDTHPSEEIAGTLQRLEHIIFEQAQPRYDSITSLLFDDQEKRSFRILPSEDYSIYHAAVEDIIERHPADATSEPPVQSQPVPFSLEDILQELSADDLTDVIHDYLDQGIEPEKVSLADLLHVLQTKKTHEKEEN
jgi:hypothetical protein